MPLCTNFLSRFVNDFAFGFKEGSGTDGLVAMGICSLIVGAELIMNTSDRFLE